jgi:chemotaxis response regulator CheB
MFDDLFPSDPTGYSETDTGADSTTGGSVDDTSASTASALGNVSVEQIAGGLAVAGALVGGAQALRAEIKGQAPQTLDPVVVTARRPSRFSNALASMSTAEKVVIVLAIGALILGAMHVIKMPKGV